MTKQERANAIAIIKALRLDPETEYEAIRVMPGTEARYGDLALKAPADGYFMKPLSGEDHRVFFLNEVDFAAYERALLSLDIDRVQKTLEDYCMLPSGRRRSAQTAA